MTGSVGENPRVSSRYGEAQVKSKTSCDLARLARDIENVVSRCSVCSKFQVENRKEPLKSHEIPDRPWQKVGVDVFELFGRDYLCTLYS